jgi:diguanylate cyclase (GGDEF)-like protein/PAS domain S-box-containing protein
MASTPSRFGPWDGDPQQAMAIASLLRRVGGTAGVHVYELEVLDGGPSYRCRVWIGQAVDSMLGKIPAGMDAEDAWEHCVHPDDRALYDQVFERQCRGETTEMEYRLVGFDGAARWMWERATPRREEDGSIIVDGVVADITERRLVEEQLAEARDRLQQLAYHDPLTGLPNRLLFNERLAEQVRRAEDDGSQFAVLFVDLDGFKAVNDKHGHAVGDALLAEVGNRLRTAAGGALVARLGGDEFLLLAGGDSPLGARADRICDVLEWPYELGGIEAVLGCSVGVALYPQDGTSSEDLIRAADAAMYRRKRANRDAA